MQLPKSIAKTVALIETTTTPTKKNDTFVGSLKDTFAGSQTGSVDNPFTHLNKQMDLTSKNSEP